MIVMAEYRLPIEDIEELRRVTLGFALGKPEISVRAFANAIGVHPDNYRKCKLPPSNNQHRKPSRRVSLLVRDILQEVEKRGAQAVRDEIMEKFATKRE